MNHSYESIAFNESVTGCQNNLNRFENDLFLRVDSSRTSGSDKLAKKKLQQRQARPVSRPLTAGKTFPSQKRIKTVYILSMIKKLTVTLHAVLLKQVTLIIQFTHSIGNVVYFSGFNFIGDV